LYPLLSRFFVEDQQRLAGVFGAGLRFVTMLALPVAALAIPLAVPVVSLVYGEKFADSAVILQILAWWGTIAVFSSLLSNYLLAANRTKTVTLQCLLSLLANLAVNFVLIPSLAGVGAAIGLVVAEMVGVLFLIAVLWRSGPVLDIRQLGSFFLRFMAALLPAFVVAWLLAHVRTNTGNITAVVGAVVVYALMLLVTGALQRQELHMLRVALRIDSGSEQPSVRSWTE
ncbi:MAG: polysaccharide biosynthesis C-terminal domain-containing protein, partial [candidate division WOR-3 bacterium]